MEYSSVHSESVFYTGTVTEFFKTVFVCDLSLLLVGGDFYFRELKHVSERFYTFVSS
ncbi:MAG: hypothetical protein ACI8P3_001185 [Saprospiraceae bacterium]|jgi:hypothetical protein